MMKAWKAAAVAALVLGSAALCAEQPGSPYIGILAGSTHFKVPDLSYSTSKITWGVFGGYQFTPYIGTELAYLRPSKVNEKVGATSVAVQASAVTGTVIGTYPFSDRWALHARLGGSHGKLKAAASNGSSSAFATDSSTELIYGVGIGMMADGARVRLEYQHTESEAIKAGLTSLSIVWFLPSGR